MTYANPATIDIPTPSLALLTGIPADKAPSVLRCLDARIARFDKDDLLADRHRPSTHTRYLITGNALMIRYDIVGKRSILGTYHADSVITSELAPSFCAENMIDIVASEPCVTLDFHISTKIEACACCIKHINVVKSNLVASLAETNMQLIKRLNTLANRSTRDKLLAFLHDCAEESDNESFSIPYSRQDLADYLYIERSALSRELGRMKNEGIISYDRNTFVLNKPYDLPIDR